MRNGRRPIHGPRDPYGAWLHFLREDAGLSQSELGVQIGSKLGEIFKASHSTISTWERTGNLPGRKIIPVLAEILDVRIETLLRIHKTGRGYSALDFEWNEKIAKLESAANKLEQFRREKDRPL